MLSLPTAATPPLGLDITALAGQAKSGDRRAIDAVAGGFESMFVSLVLKQMRQTLEPDTMFGQDQSDVLGGLFDFTMGQHLGKSGSLGIAAMVKKYLSHKVTR